MRLLTALIALGTLACAPTDLQGPRMQSLPNGLQVEGLGRIGVNEPLRVAEAVAPGALCALLPPWLLRWAQ